MEFWSIFFRIWEILNYFVGTSFECPLLVPPCLTVILSLFSPLAFSLSFSHTHTYNVKDKNTDKYLKIDHIIIMFSNGKLLNLKIATKYFKPHFFFSFKNSYAWSKVVNLRLTLICEDLTLPFKRWAVCYVMTNWHKWATFSKRMNFSF